MKTTIGPLCDDLISENKSLEIDPKALEEEKEPEKKLQQNIERLTEWCAKFLERMMSPEIISKMPKELRLIARFIGQVSDSLQLDTPVLIGGYIMLRFFNPAIATPDAMNLTTKKKTKCSQRNFILITKVIQNLANNVLFGNKEKFMICMNDFLTQKKDIMREYLMSIIDYSEKVDDSSEVAIKAIETEPNKAFERKSELNAKVDPQVLDMNKFEKRDLEKLYKLFFEYAPGIVELFIEEGVTKDVKPIRKIMNSCLDVIDIMERLGEPISITPATPQQVIMDEDEAALDNTTLQIEKVFNKICTQVWKHTTKIDGTNIENKFFFYRGNNVLTTFEEKLLVYYLIGTRLKDLDYKEGLGEIIFHMIKVMRPSFENIRPVGQKAEEKYSKKFMLVADLSFVSMSDQAKEYVGAILLKFSKLFTLVQQKQIYQTLVIHAPNMPYMPAYLVKHFAKSKLATNPKKQKDYLKKIMMIEDYTKLISYGFRRDEDVLIPEVSKFNVPKSYKIIKVNPKGKHQERLLKITMMSLLNIDPKSKVVKNERLLSEIEEISAPPSNLEIHMRFRPITPKTDQPIPYFPDGLDEDDTDEDGTKKKKKAEVGFRRYIVNSEQEREALLEEIFETVVRSQFCTTFQSFNTLLFKGSSKKAKRLLKLTADSILEVSGRVTKNEFPFIGVEYCRMANSASLFSALGADNFDKADEETDLLTLLTSNSFSGSASKLQDATPKEKPVFHKDMVALKMKNEESEHLFIITSTGLGQDGDTNTCAQELIKAVEEGVKRSKDIVTQRSLSEPEFSFDESVMKPADNKTGDDGQQSTEQ